MSAIALASAVSTWPTRAGPEIVGAPVAGSFAAVTSTVMVYDDALADSPSLTRNVNARVVRRRWRPAPA